MRLLAHSSGAALLALELTCVAGLVAASATIVRRRQRVALLGAAAVLTALAAPPLHALTDRSVTAHMVQHLVIMLVAAPLVAGALASSSLLRSPSVRGLWRRCVAPPWTPPATAVVHVVVLLVWHLPRAYDRAVEVGWLHGVEHATLLASAVWWWATVLHHAPRRNPVGVVASFLVVAATGAALGVALMFAPRRLYAIQSSVVDLQVAGALLAGSGLVYGVAMFVLVARLVGRGGTPRPRRVLTPPQLFGASSLVALGVALLAVDARPDAAERVPTPPAVTIGDASVGREIYRRDCVSCHGVDGSGSSRGIAISDVGTASVYYAVSTGRMPIDDPGDRIRRGRPAYTPVEIAALVAYTEAFVDGPAVPELVLEPSLARGGELYRLHCAACHGATGLGGAQAFGRVAPSVLHSSETEMAAAMVAGPGGMPSFRATLSDDDVAAVALYGQYLRSPVERGVPIPGGRVGEGLVAWIVGVGMLVASAAWIGRRT